MPSPFPGMDPYLEGELWTSFHAVFVPEIIRLLTPQLRPRYIALAQKYHLAGAAEEIAIAPEMYPDIGIAKIRDVPVNGAASAVISAPLQVRGAASIAVPHLFIEIRDTRQRRLVTAIEFLSPANKHNPGRKKYLRKRQRLWQSDVHLVEIDLLRKGKRVPVQDPLPAAPYFVFLSRAEQRPVMDVWPIALDQALPPVPVPLTKPDADVTVDLQTAFSAAFDLCGFDGVIDYRQAPDRPLSAQEESWRRQRLGAAYPPNG